MHRHFAPKPGDRAVIGADSKALTSDLQGFSDYGLIVGYLQARIPSLSEGT
ncbi:UNVERIFIED_ORG: D-serine deaminase-like pyridoxal phosphate-dependent protein [Rhizobium esperanzae]|nr:D-serine deaminase-like pyridoxal phosphate-dependent protein [Rhizobium esperanzae]